VSDVDLLTAEDDAIFEWAADHDHVVVTADSDFGILLAVRRTSSPSVVHLRGVADRTPDVHAALWSTTSPRSMTHYYDERSYPSA